MVVLNSKPIGLELFAIKQRQRTSSSPSCLRNLDRINCVIPAEPVQYARFGFRRDDEG